MQWKYMVQPRCPNCGGYKVKTLFSREGKKETPETVRLQARWGAMEGRGPYVVTIFWVAVVLCIGSLVVYESSYSQCQVKRTATCLQVWDTTTITEAIGLCLLILWLLWVIARWFNRRSLGPMIDRSYVRTGVHYYTYTCELCGYGWSWNSETDVPTRSGPGDSANTGLIALAQDLERKQQAQRAAAAAAYEQQRREHERRSN